MCPDCDAITSFDSTHATPRVPTLWDVQVAPFLEKYFYFICIILVGIACARIISTYEALSLTVDEPIHFACGLEYLAKHRYQLETQHPPLSRMMQALGPYLTGARPLGLSRPDWEGLEVISRSGHVDRTIFSMRLGNLPFFLVACFVVCAWSCWAFGKPVAVLTTALYTLLPATLADAGLATTDMALGATVGVAFFAVILWAGNPTWQTGLLMGLVAALACLSKFSALGYLPSSVGVALAAHLALNWPGWSKLWQITRKYAASFVFAVAVGAVVIWAAYWFSVGRVSVFGRVFNLPAPELFDGIKSVLQHEKEGHPAFLDGHFRFTGWWYYFPVALIVKTPIAFLMLSAIGTYVCLRKRREYVYLLPVTFSLGILLPAMLSRIDIGIRHIEPIWIGLSITSAIGLKGLFQKTERVVFCALAGVALFGWIAISGARQHPDYLAYFNAFAGKKPEMILVDSNYDWGQDLKLLAKRMHELGVKSVAIEDFDGVGVGFDKRYEYLEAWYGLPKPRDANTCIPLPGWNVVSTSVQKSFNRWSKLPFYRYGPAQGTPWYDQIAPVERVGPLLLYNIPQNAKFSLGNCS